MLQSLKKFSLATLLFTLIILAVFIVLDIIHGNHTPFGRLAITATLLSLLLNVVRILRGNNNIPPAAGMICL